MGSITGRGGGSYGLLRSGHRRLDDILNGGLDDDSLVVLTGPPGSGKTLLAQQYVFTNATPERPALYVSTVSESVEKILSYGQTLSYFDSSTVGKSVFYEDFGSLLNERGLPGFVDRVGSLVTELNPGLIVIDSFRALHAFAREASDFRWFLHDLASRTSGIGAASIWVGEYPQDEVSQEPEFAIADAVIALSIVQSAERSMRVLQVLKMRGSGFLSGTHAYRLGTDGLIVFPRLADPRVEGVYDLGGERITTGISDLDEMLEGGVWPGSTTLLAGPSGSGKTITAMHFLMGGVRQGEKALFASLQENPSQIERTANGFGFSFDDPLISVHYRSSVDLYLDEWVHEVLDKAEETGAKRIVVDSLGDLQFAASDTVRFREYIYSFSQRCSRRGVTLLFTLETPDMTNIRSLSYTGVSHLSDNAILLQFQHINGNVVRTLEVLKTRASGHDPGVRVMKIGPAGVEIGKKVSDLDASDV